MSTGTCTEVPHGMCGKISGQNKDLRQKLVLIKCLIRGKFDATVGCWLPSTENEVFHYAAK